MSDEFVLRRPDRLPSWLKRGLDKWRTANRLEVDEVLSELAERGLFAGAGSDVGAVKEAIVGIVISAAALHVGVKLSKDGMSEVQETNKQRTKFLHNLRSVVEGLEAEADADARSASKLEMDVDQRIADAAGEGRLFLDAFDQLVRDRTRKLKGGSVSHLANEFARGMRQMWLDATGLPLPVGGGKDLTRLAAAVWRDFDMPRDPRAKDENLEVWISDRFRGVAD